VRGAKRVFALATVLSDAYANGQQLWSYQMDVSYSVNLPCPWRSDRQALHAAAGLGALVTPTALYQTHYRGNTSSQKPRFREAWKRPSLLRFKDQTLNRDTMLFGIAASRHGEWRRMAEFIDVDPGELYLPPSRRQGADPGKLARQISKHGSSLDGMPSLELIRGKMDIFESTMGSGRGRLAAAKFRPGELVPAGSDSESAESERDPRRKR